MVVMFSILCNVDVFFLNNSLLKAPIYFSLFYNNIFLESNL